MRLRVARGCMSFTGCCAASLSTSSAPLRLAPSLTHPAAPSHYPLALAIRSLSGDGELTLSVSATADTPPPSSTPQRVLSSLARAGVEPSTTAPSCRDFWP